MAKVLKLNPEGTAKRAGIKIGDDIKSFCKRELKDIIDYIYADSLNEVEIGYINKNNEEKAVTVKKASPWDTLGIEFGDELEINKPKCCANRCMFCFVDQLPKGARESLYVKDDDYRLSFAAGSYVTLTNLAKCDIDRILEYKLSPLYVSVHASTPELKEKIFGNKKAGEQFDLIKKLTEGGIKMHTQIVMMEGVNDGEELIKTVNELYGLYPMIMSVAVVPVGLTSHRESLTNIKPISKKCAEETIKIIDKFNSDKEETFAFCSDEVYLKAEIGIPNDAYYGSYPQIENGVGLIRKLFTEIEENLENLPKKTNKTVGIITGVSGAKVMKTVSDMLSLRARKLKIEIYPIINRYFGESVTVAGLITATDIIEQLKGFKLPSEVIIPSSMLKEFDTVFLDGITLSKLGEELKTKVLVSAVDGECLIDTIVYGE